MLDLVVADDDDDYRLLLELVLAPEPDITVVGETSSAEELVEIVAAARPQLVLLDASLPGGLTAAIRVHEVAPATSIVLTSSLPARSIATAVAAASAVGSLAKDVPVHRVANALRELGALVTAAERAVRTAETTLLRDPTSPRRSRRMAQAALDGWCDPAVLADVELLITELVTNGVQHAASDVDVRIAVGATTVRVEIGDRSPVEPVARVTKPNEPGGRGMHIVEQVASRWGVEIRRTGKCVWFEVPRAPAVETSR
jgi:DNA-binding NarL/FixJ family response regulator